MAARLGTGRVPVVVGVDRGRRPGPGREPRTRKGTHHGYAEIGAREGLAGRGLVVEGAAPTPGRFDPEDVERRRPQRCDQPRPVEGLTNVRTLADIDEPRRSEWHLLSAQTKRRLRHGHIDEDLMEVERILIGVLQGLALADGRMQAQLGEESRAAR